MVGVVIGNDRAVALNQHEAIVAMVGGDDLVAANPRQLVWLV